MAHAEVDAVDDEAQLVVVFAFLTYELYFGTAVRLRRSLDHGAVGDCDLWLQHDLVGFQVGPCLDPTGMLASILERSIVEFLRTGEQVPDPLAAYSSVDRTRPLGACWVMANMVGGLDGSAAVGGRVAELSTAPDAELFVSMRTLADVVLVGAETVRREGYGGFSLPEPRVAARTAAGKPAEPAFAVVTRSLDLDWSAVPFASPLGKRPVVITCEAADPGRMDRARELADVIVAGGNLVDPVEAMAQLALRGHHVVLCEGGPTWLGQLVATDQLDELCLTISPLMGGDPLPISVSPPGGHLVHLSLKHVLAEGDTLFLRYERQHDGQ